MKQEKNGKTLYHVQSVSEWHDEPYDLFVWAKDEAEVSDNLMKLYKADYDGLEDMEDELNDLVESSNIYTVYAEEL